MKLGSFEKAVLSPPTGHKKPFSHLPRVLWPRVLRLVHTKPFSHLPRVYRHLFRVISSATAFHNLIRDQKSPERGPPRTPPECLTLLSEPVKKVCEAASSTPCLRFKPPAVTETPRKHLPLSTLQPRFKPPAVTETPRKHRKSRSLTSHGSSGWYTRSRSLLPRVLWLVDTCSE